jgi:hypothetical protein
MDYRSACGAYEAMQENKIKFLDKEPLFQFLEKMTEEEKVSDGQ